MGNAMGGPGGPPGGDPKKGDKKPQKKKFETRAGGVTRKKRMKKGPTAAQRLPTVTPVAKCKLRMLKLERVKDFLLLEQEFIQNQERLRPKEERDNRRSHQNRLPRRRNHRKSPSPGWGPARVRASPPSAGRLRG